MNFLDYQSVMNERNLIESPASVQHIVNVIRISNNIKRFKRLTEAEKDIRTAFEIEIDELIVKMENDKERQISLALREAYDKEWAIKTLGRIYFIQIQELSENMESTFASMG